MDDGSQLPWITAVLLLFAAAWFAVAETAFASASRNKIKTAQERGDSRAKNAVYVLDNFDRAITTLLICTNIVHIAAASIVTVAVTKRWGLSAVSVSTVLTTIVVFFAGEMLPKSIAKQYSERLALSCAGGLCFFMKLLTPFSALLTAIGQKAASLTADDEAEVSVTEDELYDLIEDMTEDGTLDTEQGDLISSALQFGDVTVESVVTPRVDVTAIDVEDSLEEILAVIKATNHSRLPVYEGSIDHIVGILQIRKFIKAYLHMGDSLELRPLLDEPKFVHQSMNIAELLPDMTRSKSVLAIVTDNYGGTLGIVTVEDILEELVGEIWDEDDIVKETMTDLEDGSCLADADETVSDVLEHMEYEDPEDDEDLINTLMGEWAYEQFSAIPKVGDSFEYHALRVSVEKMDHNRILTLRIERLPEPEEGGGEE